MRLLSLFVCYLALACNSAPQQSTESPTQTTSASREQTATLPPPVQPEMRMPKRTVPEITIESVAASNPVVVEGRARTFENNVVIRVRDASGALMRETFTTAAGDMGQRNPYRAEVFVTRDPGKSITVEALEYSARDGSERSLTSKTVAYEVDATTVDLYFHDPKRAPSDCSRVFAVRHTLPKSVAMARLLTEALIVHQRTPFPKGSAVQSVNLRGGTLEVDFNERLRNVGGACAAQAIRSSVSTTLQQLPSIDRVRITAGGSEPLALQP